jgi:hypothetical protein
MWYPLLCEQAGHGLVHESLSASKNELNRVKPHLHCTAAHTKEKGVEQKRGILALNTQTL